MTAATKLLERLDGVRQSAPGRWLAKCPAHEDRRPSLSIRELDDSRVLIHDFGGCGVLDVLGVIGLSLADLFDRPLGQHMTPSSSRIPARDLLAVISEETSVVALAAADLIEGRKLSREDWVRLATAAARISAARDHVHGR